MDIESDKARRDLMRLALEHRTQLWGFLMGLTKDPQKAEDLFQNTYLVICEKWDQYKPGTNFMAWARQIARFEFLASVDPSRRRFLTAEMEILEQALQAAERDEDAPSLRRDALRRCLEQLPDARGRRVLELRYAQGLSGERVAREADLSLNALYTLLSRVRRALQDCIERRLRVEEAGA
ncbi:MAG TPA: sigma-70 family RNA polymerase sigma factor [Planctomycetota bacterium]|nr:sigma-70 family RNA polymerase sigma factor [Planctomycetota bacterium]